MADQAKITISIDRGGTFTDVHAIVPGRPDIILKLLSVDPAHYQDAPTEGVRQVLEKATGESYPRGKPLKHDRIGCLRMGTTVATNALLERKGARSVLFTTKGFRDLLRIGDQSRPDIFDLSMARPGMLPEGVVEVNERVVPVHPSAEESSLGSTRVVEGVTGQKFRVVQELDLGEVRADLEKLKDQGYRSLSVALVHSYAYPEHEKLIGELAESMGFSVTLSSKLQPMVKIVPRGMSAAADAYLTPVIKSYVDSISSSFEGGLGGDHSARFEFMQSDGGLVDFRRFSGLKAILSGPAAGVVGFAATSWDSTARTPVIGFDMGGTSTDVSRFDGHLEHVFGSKVAGVMIQSPQLDINTVAAGGGSILAWRNGLFYVGPESAGAHPGPACYRKGGPLTVTDANLFLGRLLPEYFPRIFGPNEDQPLDTEVTSSSFQELTQKVNADRREGGQQEFTPEQVALGFLKVADESMARPIRNLTEARGFETPSHHLACFGGAGGQHACSVAASLGISRIIIHKYSSVLSAYGLALAEVVKESQEPVAADYESSQSTLDTQFERMTKAATAEMVAEGHPVEQVRHELYLNMRYEGSDTSLMILRPESHSYLEEFHTRHRREFNFNSDRPVLVDDIRVRTIASTKVRTEKSPLEQLREVASGLKDVTNDPASFTSAYFDGKSTRIDTPVYVLDQLEKNTRVYGPAIIIDKTQTIVVVPDAVANVLETCVLIDLEDPKAAVQVGGQSSEIDPIRLSIFGHRFMSIAEQMGRTLQKTAISTNIKERLDFSCALFSPDGALVANAPHIPVHLGSMQFAVRYQHDKWRGNLQDGDVLVANHPSCGGTHLPDITVITPVFDRPGGSEIMFYVASRGHHADIGGILPGSMPPKSTELYQEGAALEGDKIVSNGVFNEERMIDLLERQPAQFTGCSGARCMNDNLSDLKAQIAANTRGITLIHALFQEYGVATVQKYMYAIQSTADLAVRNLLSDLQARFNGKPLEAVDYMDDGSPIKLKITINPTDHSAVFDFAGTGPEVWGSWNAPVAITHSAIIYCLRCMIHSDIPLNQGCLNPIDIHIPHPSLLSPTKTAAVVGGNVVTSQRITDVVLKAFRACAASHGCCNNLTFGTDAIRDDSGNVIKPGFGYYETIAGGAGAGPSWSGESGIHVHMTNTRITDPEILEMRYPVLLRQFTLRNDSAGIGRNRGGEGVIREIEFLADMQCSILSERRVFRPFGMDGGGDAAVGLNLWVSRDLEGGCGEEGFGSVEEKERKEGEGSGWRVVNIGGKNTVAVRCNERVVVMTAGGGGFGGV